MLAQHISIIDSLIGKAKVAQARGYATKRLASYGEDEEAKAADRKARIATLRAQDWRKERFRPEKYQDLCASAMGEL